MSNIDDTIKKFRNRALIQEALARFTRYMVGAAIAIMYMNAGYSFGDTLVSVIAIGVLYTSLQAWFDRAQWISEPGESDT